jgi:hypothetical protein
MKVLREHGIISKQSEYQDPAAIYTNLCPFLEPTCGRWFTYFAQNYFDIIVEWREGTKRLPGKFESIMEDHILYIGQPNIEKVLKSETFAIRSDTIPPATPVITKAPYLLAISYDWQGSQQPSYNSYPFPFTIDLNDYRDESYTHHNLSYELVSICIVSTFAGGHYATLSKLNNKWFYCDDSPEVVEELSQLGTSIEIVAKNGHFEAHTRKYFPKLLLYQRTGLRYWERTETTSTSSLENELNALAKELNQLSILIK